MADQNDFPVVEFSREYQKGLQLEWATIFFSIELNLVFCSLVTFLIIIKKLLFDFLLQVLENILQPMLQKKNLRKFTILV